MTDTTGLAQFVKLGRWKGRKRYEICDQGHVSACWIWLGALQHHGYPNNNAHKRFYELAHGAVPPGYDVHHECEINTCVNPAHMTLITSAEHRRESICAWYASLTPEQRVSQRQAISIGMRRAFAETQRSKKI